MSRRTPYQIQIFEKLGAPLLRAVMRHEKQGEDQMVQAEKLAVLLGKSVQGAVSLSALMDVRDYEEEGDAARLALAALMAEMFGDFYAENGSVPEETDIKRMQKALEAVLTFSDNFAAAPLTKARLEQISAGSEAVLLADDTQLSVQYIHALLPVVEVVSAFSFGIPEAKMMQDVTDRLLNKAKALVSTALPDLQHGSEGGRKAVLQILAALGDLYATCHRAETERLMQPGAQDAMSPDGHKDTMDKIWKRFDLMASMLLALGRAGAEGATPQKAAPAAEAPRENSVEESAVSQPEDTGEGSAPLSAFAAKPKAPEVDEASVSQAAPSAGAEEAPASPPVPEEKADEPEGPYNPMGFFKPGASKPAGEEDGGGLEEEKDG